MSGKMGAEYDDTLCGIIFHIFNTNGKYRFLMLYNSLISCVVLTWLFPIIQIRSSLFQQQRDYQN